MTRLGVVVAAALAAMVILVVGGCDDPESPCDSGTSRPCDCSGGGTGTQTCRGGAWDNCTNCTSKTDAAQDAGHDGPAGDGPGSDADGAAIDGPAGDGPSMDAPWSDAIPGTQPWNKMPVPTGMGHTLYAVWGSGASDVYAAGDTGMVLHFDGRKPVTKPWWTQVKTTTSSRIEGLWGSGPGDLFAAALGGKILRHNGIAWASTTTGTTKAFRSIWGKGFSVIYAGGEFGTLRLNDRSTVPNSWTAVKTGKQESYLGVWGTGTKDVFVVGTTGTIFHYDGSKWTGQTSGTTEHLWAVWGSAAKDVFAVGDKGTVVRYDGAAWKKVTTPTTETLYGVWGSGPKDIFAVGAHGTILHFDGSSFSKKKSGTGWDLRAVWGSGFNDVYAVGEKMTILHFAPCECTVGTRCYQKGDRDDTGCLVCDPSKSSTTLTTYAGDCKINSGCQAKGELDTTGCQVCDPTQSTSAWTAVSSGCKIGSACHPKGQQGPVSCQSCDPSKSSSAWSQKAGWCMIGNTCVINGGKDTTACQVCDTSKSTTAWSAVPGKCYISNKCYNKGDKDTSGCLICDPSKSGTSWSSVGGKCLIGGTCYNSGAKDTSGCRSCNAAYPTDWTVDSGKCYIGGTCYNSGQKDTSGCQVCNPTLDSTAWSAVSGKCYIGGVCYSSGQSDTSGCRTCVPSKDAFNWTMVSGKCYIGGGCYSDQQKDPGGCNKCDIATSTTTWTPVGCTLGKLTPKKVTFALGTSSSSLNGSTINTDGTGLAALTDLTGLYPYYAYLCGRAYQYYPFSADEPRRLSGLAYYPIALPGGKGRIYYVRNPGKNQVSVLWVKPGGEIQVLYSTTGTSTSSLYYYFAVSDDGKRVATHRPGKGIVLMRTDGLNFSGGKPYLELDPTPAPYYIYSTSITLTNKNVYMISRATSSTLSQHTLWFAPVDGSKTTPTAVTLPNVNGTKPVFIDDEIAFSADGSKVVVTAGASYSAEDVIAIDAAGKATNVTKGPGNYRERGSYWGYSSGSQLALSTDGKYVAYASYISSYKVEVFVKKTDGTGSPAHLTSGLNFAAGTYLRLYNFKFVDGDTLVFTAYGSSSSYTDLFKFEIATGAVTNLTKTTGGTKPYPLTSTSGQYHYPYGMWFSPNKKYLYYLAYRYATPYYTTDIRGIDLATGAIKEITKGAEIYKSYESFATCAGKSVMYFVGEPKMVSGTVHQVMMFDMNTASAATTLTSLKPIGTYTYNYVYDLTPSPDCSRVAFRSGYSSKYDVYSVKPGTPAYVARLTDASKATSYHYVYDYLHYSQDSSQLIYLTGTATNQYQMRAAWSTMGPCCKDSLVHAGTGTYKYWLPFGVK